MTTNVIPSEARNLIRHNFTFEALKSLKGEIVPETRAGFWYDGVPAVAIPSMLHDADGGDAIVPKGGVFVFEEVKSLKGEIVPQMWNKPPMGRKRFPTTLTPEQETYLQQVA